MWILSVDVGETVLIVILVSLPKTMSTTRYSVSKSSYKVYRPLFVHSAKGVSKRPAPPPQSGLVVGSVLGVVGPRVLSALSRVRVSTPNGHGSF